MALQPVLKAGTSFFLSFFISYVFYKQMLSYIQLFWFPDFEWALQIAKMHVEVSHYFQKPLLCWNSLLECMSPELNDMARHSHFKHFGEDNIPLTNWILIYSINMYKEPFACDMPDRCCPVLLEFTGRRCCWPGCQDTSGVRASWVTKTLTVSWQRGWQGGESLGITGFPHTPDLIWEEVCRWRDKWTETGLGK